MCCGEQKIEQLDEGCEIRRFPSLDGDQHKRSLIRVAQPDTPGLYKPCIHYDCAHNQLKAVQGRVLGVVPKPSPEGLALLVRAASELSRTLPRTTANDINEMPARYSGGKRKRYEDAVFDVCVAGPRRSDSYVKMFVKPERFDGLTKINPDPRAIQFRGPRYCVLLAMYLHPIEHHLYLSHAASDGVPKTRNIAKGLNSVERAELLVLKASAFTDPVYLELDASRFDKHVSEELLKIEHSVYLHSNRDRTFAMLLAKQCINKVFSSLGMLYIARGRRMSGDMNTAVGNCIIMLIMLISLCRYVASLSKWDCLDDGDDSVLIIERADLEKLLSVIVPTFLSFGMTIKLGAQSSDLRKVEFCQSRIIEYQPSRFKFVRDYKAVMSKALCGIRHWEDITYRCRVLAAIGSCELVLGLGVPILQEFAVAILRNVGAGTDLKYAPDGLRLRTLRDMKMLGLSDLNVVPQEISECARESFAVSFGVPPAEQIAIEDSLRLWQFDVHGTVFWGEEWAVHSWLPNFSNVEVAQ